MPGLRDDDPFPEDADDVEEDSTEYRMDCSPSVWQATLDAIAKIAGENPITPDLDVDMQDATAAGPFLAANECVASLYMLLRLRTDISFYRTTAAASDVPNNQPGDPKNYRDTLTALMSISLDGAALPEPVVNQPSTPDSSGTGEPSPPIQAPLPPSLPPSAFDVVESASVNRYWRVVLLLVVWLNLRFHLTVRACLLILKVLRVVFITSGVMTAVDKAPITLTTAYSRLGLSDPFTIVPVCPACKYTNPDASRPDARCTNCDTALFQAETRPIPPPTPSPTCDLPDEENKGKPLLQCPGQVLSELLPQFVRRHERNCDAWRNRKPPAVGELQEIMDGNVWKEARGHDGNLFFENDSARENSTELRLGITLGFDGSVFHLIGTVFAFGEGLCLRRFGFSKSKHSPSHSSGVLSSCVGNLPYTLR